MRSTLKRLGKVALIYLVFGVGGLALICWQCLDTWEEAWPNILFGVIICVVLWEGNGRISRALDDRIVWLEQPLLRLVLGILFMVGYTVLAVSVVLWAYYVLVLGVSFDFGDLTNTIWFSLVITLVISTLLHSRGFLLNWRQSALNAERLKREQLNSRFLSLKNQLNPHFLFNSLNALSSLVYKDQDQAARFIKQLSKVYRYILEHADQEVVRLDSEMECLQAYLYLLHIRFGDNLAVQIDTEAGKQLFLPPLSLQLLVENAIKHNIVSSDQPLEVSIEAGDAWVTVRNNLQKKSSPAAGTGKGLQNILDRYQFLSDRKPEILETESAFIVKLPLLSLSQTA
ncbi:MAG: histidine kinase [Bacteroidota bacterium]